jgi:D-alanyl-D-alanine carboxypeptidase/D-alanyl-D-alanine-endopeptidase (penicillin-binding protein 4)
MWDDYPYYFQVERAAMPIYGNVVNIKGAKASRDFEIQPPYFAERLELDTSIGGKTARFYRQEKANIIGYNNRLVGEAELEKELPFIYSDSLFLHLLEKEINQPIHLLPSYPVKAAAKQVLYSIPSDSVFQRMMQVSDNFLAEQLMLLCANEVYDTINLRKAISMAKDSLFKDFKDDIFWADGSGLSRYNQFTPRSIVQLLEKIYQQMPQERWQAFFPAGGSSGTIKKYFSGTEKPYIYAKTGSMRNVRCLSGYLLTKSGRTLIFSFMNNHIPGSSRPWTKEMEKVLRSLYESL